jgi:hypothetical protein
MRPRAAFPGAPLPGVALGLLLAAGCSDIVPTSDDPDLIPIDAETFVVDLPFEDFATDYRVDGGYGAGWDLPNAPVARAEEGGGVSRALVRWGSLPTVLQVPPPGSGTSVADSTFVTVGGELRLFFDTVRVVGGEQMGVEASRVLEPFDPGSVSWTHAVDTLGAREPWSTAGGGEREPLGSALWSPANGDTVTIALDSATATALSQRDDANRAATVSVNDAGAFLLLFDAQLRIEVRPSVNPDTTVFIQPASRILTFIHSGEPDLSGDRVSVGGTPGVRTSFRFQLPDRVTASGSVCAGGGDCEIELTAERLVYAGILLQTVASPDALLAPVDTFNLDIRPVLAPQLLPRSPLGLPAQAVPRRVAPTAFRDAVGTTVEVSITRYLRDLIRGVEPGEEPLTPVVTLLAASEPSGLAVATFGGPASTTPPRLRLILTRSEGVTIP